MNDWWRSAVIYQIYPRSFADLDGDGIGDLDGITRRLPALAELGVDAIWLSPFYASPQKDAGYDVADYCAVDPVFGTIEDFDQLRDEASRLDLRVIVDLVPNHSSSSHPWFQAALEAGPGSPERARYLFRDGRGPDGSLPPNNWTSVFGGGGWTRITETDGTPGQWYLHIFDESQPDFDWTNPEVREFFRGVLHFWLDRGVDGFRVDVAHGMVKAEGLPDLPESDDVADAHAGIERSTPYWAQEGVHEIFRDWHDVLAEYGPDRALIGEAWVEPLTELAKWVRPDEMHQTFNFSFLETPWKAGPLLEVVDASLAAFSAVGAPSTWVLSNHDVVRHASRLALDPPPAQGVGIGPLSEPKPDPALGLQRARAATSFMLALPGSSYLYQGEELGLPEVMDLPDDVRHDPTFSRTRGAWVGRDGCRVPLPWEADSPALGFSSTGKSWLPIPSEWRILARDAQAADPESTLSMYHAALAQRRLFRLGVGELRWRESSGELLAFTNGDVTVISNFGAVPVPVPAGELILMSGPLLDGLLPTDTTIWLTGAA